MKSTVSFYGDHQAFLLPSNHVSALDVCPIEDVGRVVREMRASDGKGGTTHPSAAVWDLFTKAAVV